MEAVAPIKSENEYEQALKRLERVFHAKPNTPEGDLLEVLSLVIHEYEQKHHRIEPLSAIEAIKLEMAEQGLNQTGLARRLGMSKSTVSEIINGKKQMSVSFMKFVHKELGVPAAILLA
jgi:HTH-type transcriptional regulator / antitoxin HigA